MSSKNAVSGQMIVGKNGAVLDILAAQTVLERLSGAALRTGSVPSIQPISKRLVTGIVRLADAAIIHASALAVYFWHLHAKDANPGLYALVALALAISAVAAFQRTGVYQFARLRDPLAQAGRLLLGLLAVASLFAAAAFLAKQGASFSRMWFAGWLLVSFLGLITSRVALARMIGNWSAAGRLDRRAVIVGSGPDTETLIAQLEASPDADIRICGIFDDRGTSRASATVGGYPRLGTVRELIGFARKHKIDLLIVALPTSAEKRLLQVLKTLWVLPVDIRIAAHNHALRLRPRAYSFIGGVPFLDAFDRPITDWDGLVKSTFDRAVAAAMIVALSPVMALVALAVRLESKGPVLFKQKRYGFNNELVEIYKFRSMYTDRCDAQAARLVTRDDPRVTRVGRIIRRTSLDELPQLFNVLFGQLSLVGPRPHALQAKAADRLYDEVVDGYFARHRVKPGITGWAQINGWRGETDTEEKIQRRVEHDLYYIENWSVLFDVYILLRTPLALLSHKENAY